MVELFQLIEDFGNLSTGPFRQKYPDCGPFEGYGYVQRRAKAFRARAALNKAAGDE